MAAAPSAPGSSRTPSGRIPKPAVPGAAPGAAPAPAAPAGSTGNPGTRRLPAAAPAGGTTPARGGTQRLQKPAAPAGGKPPAPSPAAPGAPPNPGLRASQAMRASSRISRPPAPAGDVPPGGADAADGKPKRGVDYYIKLGALASIPVLLVILAGLWWYKMNRTADAGDPNANKPPIKPPEVWIDPTKDAKDMYDHGFDLRKKAMMETGDPALRKKLFEEALEFLKKALTRYKDVLQKFPGEEYGIAKKIAEVEQAMAVIDKELNPPKDDTSKPPSDYEEAMKIKTEAQKKYGASFEVKDVEERKQMLVDACSLFERAKKTMKLCKEAANDVWKKRCDSELPAIDSCIKSCNDELDRLNKESETPTPPETPGGPGEAPPSGEGGH